MLKKILVFLMTLTMVVFVVGCEDDNPVNTPEPEFEALQPAIDTYVGGTLPPVITADALFNNINDGDNANDYFIVSVRSADHYALGHIPGAINIPWREVAKQANVDMLPTDGSKIAVYCYTGHTGAVATTVLNSLGYEAYNMKFGIMSWTRDAGVRVASAFDESVDANDFTVETTINTPTTTYEIPETDFTDAKDDYDIILAAADAYVAAKSPVTTAATLFNNLNDGDTSNDPQIVSVRSADAYALGHIPGAINIPWREITDEANLEKLDPDREILIYCYTGHTGGVATTALNMLGYNAINMKFGMTAWTKDATVRATSAFDDASHAHDYPFNTGTTP